MGSAETCIAAYFLNALWQIPLLYAAAWLAIRLLPHAEPQTQHRIWVSTLVMETVLPAAVLVPIRSLHAFAGASAGDSAGVTTHIGPINAAGESLVHLPPFALNLLLVTYICTVLLFATRLLVTLHRTHAIQQEACTLTLSGSSARSCFYLNTLPPARLATSSRIAGPVALGVVHPLVLFPPGLIDSLHPSDLDAVLAHEFAHIRRHDFLKNLVYQVITLPIAFHPLLRRTLTRVAESRELVCDRDAAFALTGARPYAHSLLRLAAVLTAYPTANVHHALGLAEANIFERRIMKLTQTPLRISLGRRIVLASAAAMVAIATCTSASAVRLRVAPPAASAQDALKVPGATMQAAEKRMPVYPAEAKANHDTIDGPVLLAVVIGKDGSVNKIHVQQSLRPDYDASALEAVKDWRWKPYLLNGEPTEVETTVTINYSHGE